jgi:hypothetical protein
MGPVLINAPSSADALPKSLEAHTHTLGILIQSTRSLKQRAIERGRTALDHGHRARLGVGHLLLTSTSSTSSSNSTSSTSSSNSTSSTSNNNNRHLHRPGEHMAQHHAPQLGRKPAKETRALDA